MASRSKGIKVKRSGEGVAMEGVPAVAAQAAATSYVAVVGLDVGDRHSCYCVLDVNGDVLAEGTIATKEQSIRLQFEAKPRMRIALEAGTHSPWLSRLLMELGHETIVANARNLRMISE